MLRWEDATKFAECKGCKQVAIGSLLVLSFVKLLIGCQHLKIGRFLCQSLFAAASEIMEVLAVAEPTFPHGDNWLELRPAVSIMRDKCLHSAADPLYFL